LIINLNHSFIGQRGISITDCTLVQRKLQYNAVWNETSVVTILIHGCDQLIIYYAVHIILGCISEIMDD